MKNKDCFILWENIIHIQGKKLQSKDTFVFGKEKIHIQRKNMKNKNKLSS
jgi:hypothetical protein